MVLYELDDGHLGVVTLPWGSADDSGVSSGALAVALLAGLEQGVHELLVVDVSQRLFCVCGCGCVISCVGIEGTRRPHKSKLGLDVFSFN